MGDEAAAWSPEGDGTLRYLSAIHVDGGTRLYYEASRADGAHELRTEFFSDRGSTRRHLAEASGRDVVDEPT